MDEKRAEQIKRAGEYHRNRMASRNTSYSDATNAQKSAMIQRAADYHRNKPIKDAQNYIIKANAVSQDAQNYDGNDFYAETVDRLDQRSQRIYDALYNRRNQYNAEGVNNLLDSLKKTQQGVSQLNKAVKNTQKYYSQFPSKEDADAYAEKTKRYRDAGYLTDEGYDNDKIISAYNVAKAKNNKTMLADLQELYDIASMNKLRDVANNADFADVSQYNGASGNDDIDKYAKAINGEVRGDLAFRNNSFTSYSNPFSVDSRKEEKAFAYESLTDEEKAIFNYLYNTNKADAQKYLDYMADEAIQRKAQAQFDKLNGNKFLEAMSGLGAGVISGKEGVENAFSGIKDFLTGQQSAPYMSLNDYYSQLVANDLKDNKLASTAFEIGESWGQMAMSQALGLGNPVAYLLAFGTSAGGNAYKEAINDGHNTNEAAIYAMANGLAETTLEKLLGIGYKQIGRVASGTLIKEVKTETLKGAKEAFKDILKEYGKDVLSEMTEEGLQEVLDPILKGVIMGDDININLKDVAHAAIIGGLSAGLLGSPALGVNTYNVGRDIKAYKNVSNDVERKQDLIDLAEMTLPEESPERKILQERTADNITSKELESLVFSTSKATEGLSTQYLNANRAEMLEKAYKGMSSKAKAELQKIAKESGNEVMTATQLGMMYNAGQSQVNYTDAYNSIGGYGVLTSDQAERAYILGTQNKVDTDSSQVFNDALKRLNKGGTVTSLTAEEAQRLSAEENADLNVVNMDALSKKQKAAVKYLNVLSNSLGLNIRLYSTDQSEKNPNGMYKNGVVYLDVNAGVHNEQAILRAAGHELTHLIKDFGGEDWTNYSQFVEEFYGEEAFKSLVQNELDVANKAGRPISDEVAREEVIANASEMMLRDSKVIDKIVAENRTLGEKIKAFIDNFVEQLHNYINQLKKSGFSGVEANHVASELLGMSVDTFEKAQEMWDDALIKASSARFSFIMNGNESAEATELNQELNQVGLNYNEETDTVEAPTNYSTRTTIAETWEALKYKSYEDAINKIARNIANVTNQDTDTVVEWLKAEESLAAIILGDADTLDYVPDERYEGIKKNSDYPQGTVDFNNNCPKREIFTTLFDNLQKANPDILFTADDIAKIRQVLVEQKQSVACALCYVEDRRQKTGEIAETFVNFYKKARVSKDKRIYKLNSSGEWKPLIASKEQISKFGLDKRKGDDNYYLYADDKYIPTQYDLTTMDGLKKLTEEHPSVALAFINYNNSRGMASARLLEGHAEYKREILKYTPAMIKKINNLGGLRAFSFSDFQAVHLIDLVQVITDAASKGIKMQTYTKVPAFAKIARDTRMKINRSLIPATAKSENAYILLGINEDGTYNFKKVKPTAEGIARYNGKDYLTFDNVEGIDVTSSDFLNEEDSANVGNILIGISDDQIRMAMADKFVDYIIPFHTGQTESVRHTKGIAAWANYKDTQLDKPLEGSKRKKGINIYTEVLQKHKITNEVEFQEAFLAECRANKLEPRFSQFLNKDANGNYVYTEGYSKLLLDFKLFDKNGNILNQEAVMPKFDNQVLTDTLLAEKDRVKSIQFDEEVYKGVEEKLGRKLNRPSEGVNQTRYQVRRDNKLSVQDKGLYLKQELTDSTGSKLSEKQIEFFRNSKARNKDGKLIPVYHGSAEYGFTVFDPSKSNDKQSLFFTDSEEMAQSYVNNADKQYKVYLNLTNPFEIDANGSKWNKIFFTENEGVNQTVLDMVRFTQLSQQYDNEIDMATLIESLGYMSDGIESMMEGLKNNNESSKDYWNDPEFKELKALANELDDAYEAWDAEESMADFLYEASKDVKTVSTRWLSDYAKKNGYDGVIIRNVSDNGKFATDRGVHSVGDVFIAFNSNQVKSVDNINPTSDNDIYRQERTETSTRSLLANALESTAQNDAEKSFLADYKSKIATLDAKSKELFEVNKKIHEYTFGQDKPSDYKSQLVDLKAKAKGLSEAINTMDKKLLKLESTKALRDVVARERKAARSEAYEKYKEYDRNRAEGKEKTAIRHKINDMVKDFNKRMLSPNKKKYIPENLVRGVIDFLEIIQDNATNYDERIASVVNELQNTTNPEKKAELQRRLDNLTTYKQNSEYKLLKIKEQYNNLKNDKQYYNAYDDTVAAMVDDLTKTLGNKNLYTMSVDELQYTYDVIKALKKVVVDATKILNTSVRGENIFGKNLRGEELTTEDIKRLAINELRLAKQNKSRFDLLISKSGVGETYINATLRPLDFFNRISGYAKNSVLNKVYQMLEQGQTDMLTYMKDANAIFDDVLTGRENQAILEDLVSTKEKNLVDVGLRDTMGNSVKITRDMMLSLYMHLQNEDNTRHIVEGGLTVPDIKKYYGGNISGSFGETLRKVRFLDAEEVEKIKDAIENELTEWEKAFINKTHEYYDKFSKNELNRVTMELYGYKKANVDNYFPIHSDSDYLHKENNEQIVRDASLDNVGFLKKRVKGTNPIYLEGIANTVKRSIDQSAQFVGMAIPMRNYNKMTGTLANEIGLDSVMATLRESWGDKAVTYLNNLKADILGVSDKRSGVLVDKLLSEVRGNLAGANLALNPRVIIGQASSYPMAIATLDAKSVGKAFLKGGKGDKILSAADRELIAKYSPLLWYRNQGNSTQELGDINNGNTLFGKFKNEMYSHNATKFIGQGLDLIQKMDSATVGRLWYAAQYYVDDHFNLEKGTDAYYEKVAEYFNRVVYDTQPNYTALQRPAALRTKNELEKFLFMYKTQSMQNFNTLYDSTARYFAYKSAKMGNITEADIREAKSNMLKAWGSVLSSQLLYVAMHVVAAPLILGGWKKYRDDDDEVTWKSFAKGFGQDYLDAMTGMILGSDWAIDIFNAFAGQKYNSIDVSAFSEISTLMNKISALSKAIANTENPTTEDLEKLMNVTIEALKFFGFPSGNAEKLVRGITGDIEAIVNGTPITDVGVDRSNKQNVHLFYKAYQSGDTTKMNRIMSEFSNTSTAKSQFTTFFKDLLASGASEAEIRKCMKSTGLYGSADDIIKLVNKWKEQ